MRPVHHRLALAALIAPLAAGCTVHEASSFVDLSQLSFDRVRVENASGEIDISVGDKPTLNADMRYSGSNRPEITVEVNGGELLLALDCRGVHLQCSADLTLVLPESVDLFVDSSSGAVRIVGVQGEVYAEASSGAVDVIDVLGPLDLKASSGEVTVTTVAGDVRVDASSGRVTVSDVLGDLDIKASSGVIDVSDIAGDLLLDASSGAITGVGLTGAAAVVESSSGQVSLSYDVQPDDVNIDVSSGGVELLVPAGSYRVDAHASSGDVEVRGLIQDPSASSSLVVSTSSGDILIEGR